MQAHYGNGGALNHACTNYGNGGITILVTTRVVRCHAHMLLLGLEATVILSGLVTLLEFSVRSYLVGNAGSRPISEAKQPWACLVLRWGTTGEAHVLYSLSFLPSPC